MALADVSRTAVGVARIRAHESSRPDRLFNDPLAAAFVAATGAEQTVEDPSPQRLALAFHVVIRTRFFDDWLLAATRDGCRQVVLVAAGLDARAYRLDWPSGTRLFELDLAPLLELKERVLASQDVAVRCERSVVPVDLRGDWVKDLAAAGWRRNERTAWLTEGLLVYLDPPSAEHVLRQVTDGSAPGSGLAMERPHRATQPAAADTKAVTDLWKGGLEGPPEQWLSRHGWRAEVHGLAEVAARFGRPMSRRSDSGFVTARR